MSFRRAMKISFDKLKNEFETTKNPMEGLFMKKDNKVQETYIDFLNNVDTDWERRLAGASPLSSTQEPQNLRMTEDNGTDSTNLTTPGATMPTWRRRVNRFYGDLIHLKVPRDVAKMTGRTLSDLTDKFAHKAMVAKNRSMFYLTHKLMLDNYQENISINGVPGGNRTWAGFRDSDVLLPPVRTRGNDGRWSNVAMPTGTVAGTRHACPLLIDDFTNISAIMDNTVGRNSKGIGGMDSTLDSFKKVAFFSNTGWADFFNTNVDRVGHADWFGKPLLLKGYTGLYTIRDFLVVTIPDALWRNPVVNATSGSFVARPATPTDGSEPRQHIQPFHLFGGVSGTGSTRPTLAESDLKEGFHRAISPVASNAARGSFAHSSQVGEMNYALLMYRGVFSLQNPVQMQVTPQTYRDFTQRFQKKWYCEWSLEGRRDYEGTYNTDGTPKTGDDVFKEGLMFQVYFSSTPKLITRGT